jgi:hypothetical protein
MNIDGRIITPDNFYALYVEGVAPFCAGPPTAVAPDAARARLLRDLGAIACRNEPQCRTSCGASVPPQRRPTDLPGASVDGRARTWMGGRASVAAGQSLPVVAAS